MIVNCKNMKFIVTFILVIIISNIYSQGVFKLKGGRIKASTTAHFLVARNVHWHNEITTSNINLTNNTVKFTGNTNNYIGGTQSTPFYNLRIAKTSADVYLSYHQQVNNQIYMESGDLDLRNYNITLSSSATLANETYDKRIKATDGTNEGMGSGYITTTRTDPSGNVANLGLDFTPVGGNLGTTEIRRGHQRQAGSGSFTSNYSAYRYYYIIPTTMRALTINRFNYFVDGSNPSAGIAELHIHPEANLQMFQRAQYNGGSNPIYWEPRNTTVNAASDYVQSATGINSLNYIFITLASTTNPLPVQLITFNGNCIDKKAMLNWITTSEFNNYGFYVEKSNDGNFWFSIGFVSGNLNSNTINQYSFIDQDPYSTTYYRLKQIDVDGNATYSDVIVLNCNQSIFNEDIIPVYQDGTIAFIVRGEPGKQYELLFTNVLGQKLLSKQITLTSPQDFIEIYEPIFVTGIYYVSMVNNSSIITKPILLNKQ